VAVKTCLCRPHAVASVSEWLRGRTVEISASVLILMGSSPWVSDCFSLPRARKGALLAACPAAELRRGCGPAPGTLHPEAGRGP